MSAIDAGIQMKMHGSGTTTLITSNEEMNDIMKIVQALWVQIVYVIIVMHISFLKEP